LYRLSITEKKCDYSFSELSLYESKIILKVKDCNNKPIGEKELGYNFSGLKESDKAVILSYTITDIIKNPGIYYLNSNEQKTQISESTDKELPAKKENLPITENHHASRHVFTPTAYSLNKGELY
jgi:hypothetical protein